MLNDIISEMVSNGDDEHEDPKLEMSGNLEEFLMPSSPKNLEVRNSMDSFKVSLETYSNFDSFVFAGS